MLFPGILYIKLKILYIFNVFLLKYMIRILLAKRLHSNEADSKIYFYIMNDVYIYSILALPQASLIYFTAAFQLIIIS